MPLLAFVFSFFISYLSIPSIIQVAQLKHLFDEPDKRKLHKTKIPTLGGLAIFAGMTVSTLLFTNISKTPELQYVLAAILILFFIGIKDDIIILSALSKFLGQILATIIIVWFGNIRIESFGGIFGIHNLPYLASISFSMLTLLVIINSLNLIDGIDGLAGTISFIVISAYAAWFYKAGFNEELIFSLAAMGALLAFLRYNITPAKIFMGDTGSLLMGTIIGVLTIKFVALNRHTIEEHKFHSAPVLAISILIIPLFDLARVFFVRILNGKSPFNPDKIHVHHKLLDLGLNHLQATFLLSTVNVMFICFVFVFQKYNITYLFLSIIIIAVFLMLLLEYFLRRKINQDAKK